MTYFRRSRTGFIVTFCLLFSPITAFSGEPWSSAVQMSDAAQAFVQTLNAQQKKAAVFPLDDSGRTTWSNLPVIMVRPGGLLINDMNSEQRIAVHRLLRASMSSQGYGKFSGIMQLEEQAHLDAIAELDKSADASPEGRAFAASYDSENYAVAVFGKPGDLHWGWKIAGHHAAANFTISKGRVGFTPTFLGSSPMVIQSGKYAGYMALPNEGNRGLELMLSLDEEQQNAAIVASEKPRDVIEGPGRRSSLKEYEGLKADRLSAEQARLLRVLVAEYVGNSDFDSAEDQLKLIEKAGWDELWFSWRGPVEADGRFYYRVHGPRILIEYSRQNENHDHTLVRDPKNDYGEDWLGQHYEEHHPTMQEAMENVRKAARQ